MASYFHYIFIKIIYFKNFSATFRNEDFGGLVPNVTYTATDHGASFKGRIVQIHENGTFTPLTNFFTPGKDKLQMVKAK